MCDVLVQVRSGVESGSVPGGPRVARCAWPDEGRHGTRATSTQAASEREMWRASAGAATQLPHLFAADPEVPVSCRPSFAVPCRHGEAVLERVPRVPRVPKAEMYGGFSLPSSSRPRRPLQRSHRLPPTLCATALATVRSAPVPAAALHTRAAPSVLTLNRILVGVHNARGLLQLHEEQGHAFDNVNLATCWRSLGRVSAVEQSRLRADDGALLSALREQTRRQLGTFQPRHVSGLALTLAHLDIRGASWRSLWTELEEASLARRGEFKPQELANAARAFAMVGHAAPALFDAIRQESTGRVREFNSQDLSNTAWAFATAGHAAPALFDAIGKAFAQRVREFTPRALANTAWAFALLDHPPAQSSLFDRPFARRCEAFAYDFRPEALCQLHQWRLWYASERACSDALPGPALLTRCDAAFRAAEAAQPTNLQSQVAEAVVALGAPVQEHKLLQTGYSLGLVVDCGGEELIALEVDGPSHFVGREPTGATRLRRRQLRHFGWRLVSVPYWEWEALDHRDASTQREQRAAYLSALLEEAAWGEGG